MKKPHFLVFILILLPFLVSCSLFEPSESDFNRTNLGVVSDICLNDSSYDLCGLDNESYSKLLFLEADMNLSLGNLQFYLEENEDVFLDFILEGKTSGMLEFYNAGKLTFNDLNLLFGHSKRYVQMLCDAGIKDFCDKLRNESLVYFTTEISKCNSINYDSLKGSILDFAKESKYMCPTCFNASFYENLCMENSDNSFCDYFNSYNISEFNNLIFFNFFKDKCLFDEGGDFSDFEPLLFNDGLRIPENTNFYLINSSEMKNFFEEFSYIDDTSELLIEFGDFFYDRLGDQN